MLDYNNFFIIMLKNIWSSLGQLWDMELNPYSLYVKDWTLVKT